MIFNGIITPKNMAKRERLMNEKRYYMKYYIIMMSG